MNITTSKITDVQRLLNEGIERVTPNMWNDFINHVIKEEDRVWDIDFI